MAYVITEPCIDELDGSCIEVCPVDCIYLGERARYINPMECIECGACEPACPMDAIFEATDVPTDMAVHKADNEAFFTGVLPGRDRPLGCPGSAKSVGGVAVDTALIAAHPRS